jgi:hypothetical protein
MNIAILVVMAVALVVCVVAVMTDGRRRYERSQRQVREHAVRYGHSDHGCGAVSGPTVTVEPSETSARKDWAERPAV